MADRIVMMPADQAAREQLAEDMKKLAENPLSETVPGGRYINAAGETVDANGKVLGTSKASAAEGDDDGDESTASKSAAKKRGR